MGEYARRAADGASVKIGTCEDMYYLRFDQRHLVGKEDNSLDVNDPSIVGDLRFRFPFPDEDHVGCRRPRRHPGSHRLTLADFAWRNWDYDAAAICKRNSEWSD